MIKLIVATSLLTVSFQVAACRDSYLTHESRMENADIAFVARVTGIAVPSLERDTYDDKRDILSFVRAPRTIRLIATHTLKGSPEKFLELVVEQCNGALYAKIGGEVRVYKLQGGWRLAPVSE